jgi:hypothetical protein
MQKLQWHQWGSSLQGLRSLDPLLGPPSTPAETSDETVEPAMMWEQGEGQACADAEAGTPMGASRIYDYI